MAWGARKVSGRPAAHGQGPGTTAGIYAAEALEGRGVKRRMTADEGKTKVKRTVAWLCHNGGLQQEIIYKSCKDHLEAIDPKDALRVLKDLAEQGPAVRDPTAWIKARVESLGPGLDYRIGRTIAWYNRWGELRAAIRYDEVKDVFAALPIGEAHGILKDFEPVSTKVSSPTSWLYAAAERRLAGAGADSEEHSSTAASWGGDEPAIDDTGLYKLGTTIAWYNKFGGLSTPIIFDECIPYLVQLDLRAALDILKGIDDKRTTINSPTGWIIGAARKAGAGTPG